MLTFRSSTLALAAIALLSFGAIVDAFSATVLSPRFDVTTATSTVAKEEATASATEKPQNKIPQLRKKLGYWKQEQKAKELEYKQYQVQKACENKSKPIYRREGKIDHYSLRPVYDQHTERIQTEIWSIKEQIQITQARLHEERRVEQVQLAVADKLSRHDEEIRRLRQEAALKLQAMQDESTAKLTEKEQQIMSATRDIQNLSIQLKKNRDELRNKEICLNTLEKNLKQTEAIMHHLTRERASIRALIRQSWRVLKGRFRKTFLHKEDATVELAEAIMTEIAKEKSELSETSAEASGAETAFA